MDRIPVKTEQGVFEAEKGEDLLRFLHRIGISVPSDCGGAGTCGKCAVDIVQGGTVFRVKACSYRIREEIGKREAVFKYYDERFRDVPGIRTGKRDPLLKSNYSYYPLVFDGFRRTRDEVYERLLENGIRARKYFWPITSDLECYRSEPFAGHDHSPCAFRISERVLTLPLYADLPPGEAARIADLILG